MEKYLGFLSKRRFGAAEETASPAALLSEAQTFSPAEEPEVTGSLMSATSDASGLSEVLTRAGSSDAL